jgi:hypothetical protein
MGTFQQLVGIILERKGYWVWSGFKVGFSKAEKRAIDRPSSPRWELDIIAYKGASNELLVVECKSYLDPKGVTFKSFDPHDKTSNRYKLFIEPRLRQTVFRRLTSQLVRDSSGGPLPAIKLCLAAGKTATEQDHRCLTDRFQKEGWRLWDDDWIRNALKEMSESGYEHDTSAVVAKLLLRQRSG